MAPPNGSLSPRESQLTGDLTSYIGTLSERAPGTIIFRTGAGRIQRDLLLHWPALEGLELQAQALCNRITGDIYPLTAALYAQAVEISVTISPRPVEPPGEIDALSTYVVFDADKGVQRTFFLSPDQIFPSADLMRPQRGIEILCRPLNYYYHTIRDDRGQMAQVHVGMFEMPKRMMDELYETPPAFPPAERRMLYDLRRRMLMMQEEARRRAVMQSLRPTPPLPQRVPGTATPPPPSQPAAYRPIITRPFVPAVTRVPVPPQATPFAGLAHLAGFAPPFGQAEEARAILATTAVSALPRAVRAYETRLMGYATNEELSERFRLGMRRVAQAMRAEFPQATIGEAARAETLRLGRAAVRRPGPLRVQNIGPPLGLFGRGRPLGFRGPLGSAVGREIRFGMPFGPRAVGERAPSARFAALRHEAARMEPFLGGRGAVPRFLTQRGAPERAAAFAAARREQAASLVVRRDLAISREQAAALAARGEGAAALAARRGAPLPPVPLPGEGAGAVPAAAGLAGLRLPPIDVRLTTPYRKTWEQWQGELAQNSAIEALERTRPPQPAQQEGPYPWDYVQPVRPPASAMTPSGDGGGWGAALILGPGLVASARPPQWPEERLSEREAEKELPPKAAPGARETPAPTALKITDVPIPRSTTRLVMFPREVYNRLKGYGPNAFPRAIRVGEAGKLQKHTARVVEAKSKIAALKKAHKPKWEFPTPGGPSPFPHAPSQGEAI